MAKNIYFAEFIGAFTLVFFGCGAIMINELYPQLIGNMGIATTFGLMVMILIYSLGSISGAHMNPAVSIAFVLAGKLQIKYSIFYIASQIIGAILASFLLLLILPETSTLGQTNPKIPVFSAFLIELLASFFLMLVILNVANGHKEEGILAGVAIGSLILIEALIFGPLTGASMNPARSIGPALIALDLSNLWLYILAPVVGTILAVPTCKLLRGSNCCND
jgi:aquaporin Z